MSGHALVRHVTGVIFLAGCITLGLVLGVAAGWLRALL